jgi:hypothetical protein
MKTPTPYSKLEKRLITLRAELQATLALVEMKIAMLAYANRRKSCP